MMGHYYGTGYPQPTAPISPGGHIRSTSYSISYGRGKPMASPTADIKGIVLSLTSSLNVVSYFGQDAMHGLMM